MTFVPLDDIMSLSADAAVLPLEMSGAPTDGRAAQTLAAACGERLRPAIRRAGFLVVGSAAVLDVPGLPFPNLIATAVPRWLTGKANELLVLHRCYESVYALAQELGCRSLVSPFLSCCYFHFPQDDAVHIALRAAKGWEGETVFAADTEELLALSEKPWQKPRILSYIGYYRDHALFALDNGLFARVDIRPERRDADVIPYFEACYREGNNPLQRPLSKEEILRLRRIWEETEL
jgi:O-acetyl-ADP-ribose deacetylase (regulator of RNase III)